MNNEENENKNAHVAFAAWAFPFQDKLQINFRLFPNKLQIKVLFF